MQEITRDSGIMLLLQMNIKRKINVIKTAKNRFRKGIAIFLYFGALQNIKKLSIICTKETWVRINTSERNTNHDVGAGDHAPQCNTNHNVGAGFVCRGVLHTPDPLGIPNSALTKN
jgi:hypothetical protein